MKIKPLTIDDLDAVSKLDFRFKSPWSRGLYTERMERYPNLSHGAYEHDNLVGFILGKDLTKKKTYISRVVVSKKHEGRGIGKKLMKEFEYSSRNKQVESTIRSSNKRSLNLHRSMGYKIDDDYEYVYNDGDRGVKFWKNVF